MNEGRKERMKEWRKELMNEWRNEGMNKGRNVNKALTSNSYLHDRHPRVEPNIQTEYARQKIFSITYYQ